MSITKARKVGEVAALARRHVDLKSEVYSGLRLTLDGVDADGLWKCGALHFNDRCDREFFKQLTAEHIDVAKSGARSWKKHYERNEQLDMAVYSRALARHLTDRLSEADWTALSAERVGAAAAQADLSAFWSLAC